jgi:Domain of unknown function (DUF1905)/Bacteriocin-protection, YdeI or OmpD-Associated
VCSTDERMLAMSPAKAAPAVRFEAPLYTIDGSTILLLPGKASHQLPSRGQVAVQATVNGHACQTVAEPDGESGHWVRIDAKQQRAAALRAGDTAEVELVPLEDWPEPNVPPDLRAALAAAPDKIRELWKDITPMARWEWVRWVNATRAAGTHPSGCGAEHVEDSHAMRRADARPRRRCLNGLPTLP